MLILYDKYDEEFKTVTCPGIKKNMYKISNYGRVISIRHNKIMRYRIDKNGYHRISLMRDDGTKYRIGIHRLVAWEFCDGYDEKSEKTIPNHKDSDPSNNYFLNLEWVDSSYNSKYAYIYGNRKARKGEESNFSKYKECQIEKVCELLENGYSRKYASKITGVSKSYITDIVSGKKWYHVRKKYNLPKQREIKFKGFDSKTKQKILNYIKDGYKPKEICMIMNIQYTKTHKIAITNLRKKINK